MSSNNNTNIEEIDIPNNVIEAFWAVRETGLVNMFDGTGVVRVMMDKGMYEAAGWLIDYERGRCNTKKYGALLKQIRESTDVMNELK